jgi:hypothetical protein
VKLRAVPVELIDANAFVREHHRHNKPTAGHRFSIGATLADSTELVGVAIIGRPIARLLQDGRTAEVLRVCVLDDAPKGSCSFLYACAWRAWRAMGGERLVTYTLQDESGASLRGAGWRAIHASEAVKGKGWLNRPNRAAQGVYDKPKIRWEIGLFG